MKSAKSNQANKPLYNLLKISVIKSLDIFAFKPNKHEAVQQNTIEIERTVDY